MSEVFTKLSTLESLYLTSTNTAGEKGILKSVEFINPDSPWSERPQDNMKRNGIGTTDEIANVYDTRCGCTWKIGGKIDGGRNYSTTWIPRASGTFKEYYLGTLIEQNYYNLED